MHSNTNRTTVLGSEGQIYYWDYDETYDVKQLDAEPMTHLYPNGHTYITQGQSGSLYISDMCYKKLKDITGFVTTAVGPNVTGIVSMSGWVVFHSETTMAIVSLGMFGEEDRILHKDEYDQPIRNVLATENSVVVQTATKTILYYFVYVEETEKRYFDRRDIAINQRIISYTEPIEYEYFFLTDDGNVFTLQSYKPVLFRENVRQLIPLERIFACVYVDGTVECPYVECEALNIGTATVYPYKNRFIYVEKNTVNIPSFRYQKDGVFNRKIAFFKPEGSFKLDEDVSNVLVGDGYIVVSGVFGSVYFGDLHINDDARNVTDSLEKVDFFNENPIKVERHTTMKNARSV